MPGLGWRASTDSAGGLDNEVIFKDDTQPGPEYRFCFIVMPSCFLSLPLLGRVFLTTAVLLGAVGAVGAATFTVTTDASTGPGSFHQAMLDGVAVPKGTVVVIDFEPVFFAEPRTVLLTEVLPVLKRSVSIDGPALGVDGRPMVTLSGDRNANGVADVGDAAGLNLEVPTGGALSLRRVSFLGFRSTATAGGAVFFRPDGAATALIEQCVFTGGSGRWGGAVSFEGVDNQAIVRNCIFVGNRATEFDGGALSLGRTLALVEGCEFRQNSAPTGGGAVHSFHGAAELRACLFEGNDALPSGAGGAVSARVGLKVTGCSFVNNQARAGGALFLNQMRTPDPGAVLINSTFSGNSALSAAGGAIYAIGTDAMLRQCTVTLNQANKNGAADAFLSGGGFAVPGAANLNRLQLHNCVVAGNLLNGPGPGAGTDLHGPAVSYISLGGNVIGIADTLAAVFNQPGDKTGMLAAPLAAGLAPLAATVGQLPSHSLQPESPALDTGVPGPDPAIVVDQLGAVRPSGPAADAGAVEVVGG